MQFVNSHFILGSMIQPLALIVYERLLPGSQLVNRLQDLKYRVQTLADGTKLVACAQAEMPMIVLIDLISTRQSVCDAIADLRQNAGTTHIPVIAFSPEDADKLQSEASKAGATLVVSETAILSQLPHFLDQALQIE